MSLSKSSTVTVYENLLRWLRTATSPRRVNLVLLLVVHNVFGWGRKAPPIVRSLMGRFRCANPHKRVFSGGGETLVREVKVDERLSAAIADNFVDWYKEPDLQTSCPALDTIRLSVRSRASILTFAGNQIRKAQDVIEKSLYDVVTVTSPPLDSLPVRKTKHLPGFSVSTETEAMLLSLILHATFFRNSSRVR